jgi:hypothetical protein
VPLIGRLGTWRNRISESGAAAASRHGSIFGPEQLGRQVGPFRLDHVAHLIADHRNAVERFELTSDVL